nr:carbohydrate-binding protein [uncultured Actinoplanes sp.]
MPSVYRTRSYVLRRRALIGLAGVALLLVGYGLGRWQDTPAPIEVTAPPSPSPSKEAAPTTSPPPSPTVYQTMQAEAANALNGIQTQDTEDQGGGQNVGWIASGDSLRFDDVDFGPVPATQLEVRVASDADGGRMEVHIDSPEKPAVGALSVTRTGGWQSWRTDLVTLTPVTGTHTVFLTFVRPDGNEFLNVNWLLLKH